MVQRMGALLVIFYLATSCKDECARKLDSKVEIKQCRYENKEKVENKAKPSSGTPKPRSTYRVNKN